MSKPFKVEFKINGRKVSPQNLGRAVEGELKKAVSKNISQYKSGLDRRIRQTRCPVHHETPKAVRTSYIGNQLKWQWNACCDGLSAQINSLFR